ncbi:MAG: HAD-IA family hydrolase [Patescibacteria group bacterium]|jgi:DNA transformation protein
MVSSSFSDYLLHDVMAAVPGITARPLFGALALYKDGIVFGIVRDERVYFKADSFTDFYFTEKDCEQFSYKSGGRVVHLPYWELPEDVLEDKDELHFWIERSASVAEQGAKRQARLVKTKASKAAAEIDAALSAKPTTKIRAVLFDCFGIFFGQLHEDWLAAQVPQFAGRREEFLAIAEKSDRGDIPYGEFVARVASTFYVDAKEFENGVLKSARVNGDMLKVLNLLRPRYRVGLLSNSSKMFVGRLLARFALQTAFDSVTVSSELHSLKPDRKIFIAALKSLGVLPEATIYIDDKERNVEGALAAGIQSGIVFINAKDCIAKLHQAGVNFQ